MTKSCSACRMEGMDEEVPIAALKQAVEGLHGCRATFREVVPVLETFREKVVWDGEVHIFDLAGHPVATRCYAWSHQTEGGKRRFFAILHEGKVDSPLAAVRAAIVQQHRESKRRSCR